MCSWPITDEVPDVDALAPCALCDEVFPFVNVLSCRRLKGGQVPICLTCHQRFHPACTKAQSVLGPSHYECRVCGGKQAVVICALCSLNDSKDEILEGVLMCKPCSDHIHSAAKRHHSDHFYPVASPAVVAVKGPVHWHNFIDILLENPTNQSQPRAPARQQNTAHECRGAQGSSNQHRDSNPRGVDSNPRGVESNPRGVDSNPNPKGGGTTCIKHLVISGNSSQPLQVVKTKVNGGSFERLSRVI